MIICVQRDHTSSFVDWFSSNSQPLLKTGKCSQDLPDVNSFSGTAFDADLSTGSRIFMVVRRSIVVKENEMRMMIPDLFEFH